LWTGRRQLAFAALTGAAYFLGAKFGLMLTFAPSPVSTLWPPNAILLAALIIAPTSVWPKILAAVLPAHLIAELGAGVPTPMVFCWFASNCLEALIGAAGLRWLRGFPFRFDNLANVWAFVGWGALVGPIVSSFVDAWLVHLNHWGNAGYFEVWETRLFSSVLAALTIVPAVVSFASIDHHRARRARPARILEALLVTSALSTIGILVFIASRALAGPPLVTLLYLPVPLLIWAALRFGTPGASGSFALITLLVTWGAGHGQGPFRAAVLFGGPRAMQIYLIFLAPPLLTLTAVLEERRRVELLLRGSEDLFSRAFRSSPLAMSISSALDGRIIDVNDRWETLFGYAREEVLGKALLDYLPLPPVRRESAEYSVAALAGGRELEVESVNRHGDKLRLMVASERVELDRETGRLTTIRDITAQRRAEVEAAEQRRQLTHLSRVNLLGELSGALAHEINQPLTAILNNVSAAERFLARTPFDVEQVRETLDDIGTAGRRAGTVIQRLRALLRKDDRAFEPIDLAHLLEETLDFSHGEVITHDVVVHTEYSRPACRPSWATPFSCSSCFSTW
jgi:PAS domain S-box-containing protein